MDFKKITNYFILLGKTISEYETESHGYIRMKIGNYTEKKIYTLICCIQTLYADNLQCQPPF